MVEPTSSSLEVLVELSSLTPWEYGAALRLAFSGDALNAAAASAAAGAHTALVARVPGGELGDALVRRVAELGIDATHLVRTSGQHGVYLSHADPEGQRQFVDWSGITQLARAAASLPR